MIFKRVLLRLCFITVKVVFLTVLVYMYFYLKSIIYKSAYYNSLLKSIGSASSFNRLSKYVKANLTDISLSDMKSNLEIPDPMLVEFNDWIQYRTSPECGNYTMVVMVTSLPKNKYRRDSIRQTWGRGWHGNVEIPTYKTIFQLGSSPRESEYKLTMKEYLSNRDMLIGSFTDSFYNLPIKVMMGFKWASSNCKFKYLFKVDDDVFVHVPRAFEYLSQWYIPSKRLYTGKVQQTPEVQRGGKYKITEEEYPLRFYPQFVSGGGIILSPDVVEAMVKKFNISNFFKLDDVYLGMLALEIGVFPINEEAFNVWHKSSSCKCLDNEIVYHRVVYHNCVKKVYDCM